MLERLNVDFTVLPPMIINTTRYITEDIEQMVRVLWDPKKSLRWVLTVKYASSLPDKPYHRGQSGPYVKFARNGDEGSDHKVLVLTQPQHLKCDPLVALASGQSRMVPDDMLYEVCRRIELISDYHGGGRNSKCDEYAVYPWNVQPSKFKDAGLTQLRFAEKIPSKEMVSAQKRRVESQRQYLQTIAEFNYEIGQASNFKMSAERNRMNAKREIEWAERNEKEAANSEVKAANEIYPKTVNARTCFEVDLAIEARLAGRS